MATVPFTVSYTQADNTVDPGEITFNGDTKPASGRLDTVGSFVFADGFSLPGYDYDILIECVRTSKHRMQIRIIFTGFDNSVTYEDFIALEKVINDVPLDFH